MHQHIGMGGITFNKILMVVLGGIKFFKIVDLGGDRLIKSIRGFELLNISGRNLFLFWSGGKNGGTILPSHVCPLAIYLGRIMANGEENFQ